MRYENEKCPACGEIFTENDEAVVCPDCGTPQHRSCYNENGHCVNEHLHEAGFVWEKLNNEAKAQAETDTGHDGKAEDSDVTVCPDCGAENKKRALVCTNCGAVLSPEIREQFEGPKTAPVFIDGKPVNDKDYIDEEQTVTVKEAACFIQSRKESYIKTFLDAKVNNRKPKFNIAAFFFGPYWFFFRKIYKAGFAFAGVIFAINCFVMSFFMTACGDAMKFFMENYTALAQNPVDEALYSQYIELVIKGIESHQTEVTLMIVMNILLIVVNIVAGILANKLYLNHIKTTIAKIKSVVPNPSAYYTYIYAKGGTTILNAFLIGMAIYYLTDIIFSQALI